MQYIVDREARVFNPRLAFRTLLLPLPVRFIRKNPGRCDVFEVKSTSQASDVVIVGKKRSVFDVSSVDVAGPFILSLHREEITVTPTLNYGDMYLLLSFRIVSPAVRRGTCRYSHKIPRLLNVQLRERLGQLTKRGGDGGGGSIVRFVLIVRLSACWRDQRRMGGRGWLHFSPRLRRPAPIEEGN